MQQKTIHHRNDLTPRRLQLLTMIADFTASRCYSPTIAELACELGISRSTAFEHITQLRRDALLCAVPGRARSLKLTLRGRGLLDQVGVEASYQDGDGGGVPLLGQIAAGLPREAIENTESLQDSGTVGCPLFVFRHGKPDSQESPSSKDVVITLLHMAGLAGRGSDRFR